jgi:hypothetical protein
MGGHDEAKRKTKVDRAPSGARIVASKQDWRRTSDGCRLWVTGEPVDRKVQGPEKLHKCS